LKIGLAWPELSEGNPGYVMSLPALSAGAACMGRLHGPQRLLCGQNSP